MHFTFILAGFPLARAVAGQAAATQGPTAVLARAERPISHKGPGVSRCIQRGGPGKPRVTYVFFGDCDDL
jgi:hypothetical protein